MARMIGELVVEHDRLGLPGVGTFYAEVVPASFSDRGYTINPPYRRLSFLPVLSDDDKLAEFHARTNNMPLEMSRSYLSQFLAELKNVLMERKTITLPGLGCLRATTENNFFFVADRNLEIYPETFGLGPVSLRTHSDTSEPVDIHFEFKADMDPVPEVGPDPVIETQPEPRPEQEPVPEPEGEESEPPAEPESEPQPDQESEVGTEPETTQTDLAPEVEFEPEPVTVEEPVQEPEPEPEDDEFVPDPDPLPVPPPAPKKKFRWWIVLLVLLLVAVLALVAFLVLARIAPEFIDSILYTPEELMIINY